MGDAKREVLQKLLECYVLGAIGQLDDAHEQELEALAETLRAAWSREGSWRDLVEAEVELPGDFSMQVRSVWGVHRGEYMADGGPEKFARMYIEEHFG